MPTRKRSCSGSRDGLALIIVLAFIVLLTILVVSFISFSGLNRTSTGSYSKSIQAQEIALGGLQDILSDLHNEIIAGSNPQNGGSSTYPMAYIPWTNYTAAPARIGFTAASWGTDTTPPKASPSTLSPTLIRVSRATNNSDTYSSASFFTNLTASAGYYTNNIVNVPGGTIASRASTNSLGTATPSANGRYISNARWNTTYLLATNAASVPTPFTNAPPDWVYVTRSGSRALTAAQALNSLPSNNLTNITTGTGSSQGSPIVGRYAFVMYDEGATLDANAAGYLSSATNTGTAATGVNPSYTNVIGSGALTNNIQTLSGKSYLAYADLSQLPGLTNYTSGAAFPGQTAIDNLIARRNAGGFAGASSPSGTTYLAVMTTNAAGGFLSFVNSGTTYDSPPVSRQDLINYFTSIDPGINTSTATFSQALPYLGTFTREVNAPSYFPPSDAANIPGWKNTPFSPPLTPDLSPVPTYHTSMESTATGTTTIANRDLANVRFATAATVTHYNDDATSSTYSVAAGDPLLQRRFSLARINWLSQTWVGEPDPGTTSPSYSPYATTGYPAAIKACFGLVWDYPSGTSGTMANGGNKCWNYVGSSSTITTAAGLQSVAGITIETLAQVAAESTPREPNFFELLKAAILNGSLGKSPGTSLYSNGTSTGTTTPSAYNLQSGTASALYGPAGYFSYSFDGHWSGTTPSYLAPASIPDCQIIQIGANIIDQYDADSFPTAIYFKYAGVGPFDAVNTGTTTNGDYMTPIYGPVDMFFGDENLPYIHAIFPVSCSPDPAGAANPPDATDASMISSGTWTGGTTNEAAWMQPQLWNPHQQPATPLFPNGQKYQMRAYGEMQYQWDWTNNTPGATLPNPWYVDNYAVQPLGTGTINPYGTINFTDSSNTSSFYARPYLLTSDSIPTNGAPYPNGNLSFPTTGALANTTTNIAQPNYPYYSYTSYNNLYHFVGFYIGTTPNPSEFKPLVPSLNEAFYTPPWMSTDNVHMYHYPQNVIGTLSKPLSCNTYSLGWVDSSNQFHPYSYFTGAFGYAYEVPYADRLPSGENGSVKADTGAPTMWAYVDPRTSRFSEYDCNFSGDLPPFNTTTFSNATLQPGFNKPHSSSGNPNGGRPSNMPNGSGLAMPNGNGFVPSATSSFFPSDYEVNTPTATIDAAAGQDNGTYAIAFYADPDGVIRPADGFFGSGNRTGSPAATGDGEMLFTDTASPTGGQYASGDSGGNVSHGRRPVILNRPFRNVGELGYTFRDLPFKTLDFFSEASADAGLLDVFSVTDEPKVVAGRLALSNAPKPVIQAVLVQGSKKDYDPSYNMGLETTGTTTSVAVALAIATNLKPASGGPLLNRAGLVTQLGVNPTLPRLSTLLTVPVIHTAMMTDTLTADAGNKAYFEAPMRALSSVTNTRTWDLMIDIIAQSGHLSPTATSLDNFVVEGEKRYWLHIAIDRYTGKIVDQQLEPVYE